VEDPGLGGAITLERMMAVEMIGREVQEHADIGTKLFDQLQLKTAELRNGDGLVTGLFHVGNQGRANVARQNRGETRILQNVLNQRRCRRLLSTFKKNAGF